MGFGESISHSQVQLKNPDFLFLIAKHVCIYSLQTCYCSLGSWEVEFEVELAHRKFIRSVLVVNILGKEGKETRLSMLLKETGLSRGHALSTRIVS